MNSMEPPKKKILNPAQALLKAQSFCAFQERSQQEMRDKLYGWGLHQKDVEEILALLVSDGFLKEERFAVAYAGGKFRVKKWGRVKIRQGLKAKSVSDPLIKKALGEISEIDYRKALHDIIQRRSKESKEKNPLKRKYKIASYAIGRGYEPELVWEALRDDFDE
jgi:regulatory protein